MVSEAEPFFGVCSIGGIPCLFFFAIFKITNNDPIIVNPETIKIIATVLMVEFPPIVASGVGVFPTSIGVPVGVTEIVGPALCGVAVGLVVSTTIGTGVGTGLTTADISLENLPAPQLLVAATTK